MSFYLFSMDYNDAVKKVKVITPSKLLVELDDRKIVIQGEVTLNHIFYADISSIKKWEPPHENIPITEDDKKELIKIVSEESKKTAYEVTFD